jgi:hypothetical protein
MFVIEAKPDCHANAPQSRSLTHRLDLYRDFDATQQGGLTLRPLYL